MKSLQVEAIFLTIQGFDDLQPMGMKYFLMGLLAEHQIYGDIDSLYNKPLEGTTKRLVGFY
jgi:hypothetical protein